MGEHILHNPSSLLLRITTTIYTIFFCLLFLTTFPQYSHSQAPAPAPAPISEPVNKYSNCWKPVRCGGLPDISYPFWGGNRPIYCGGSNQFKLNCHKSAYNNHPKIVLDSQIFYVLHINTTEYIMRIVRQEDLLYDPCNSTSKPLTNFSLESNRLQYTPSVYNITIYYDCPSDLSNLYGGGIRNITCRNHRSSNSTTVIVFYWEETLLEEYSELGHCRLFAEVHVSPYIPAGGHEFNNLKKVGDEFNNLKKVLRGGFELDYYASAMDEDCNRCLESNGICGRTDSYNYYQFACHCPDGSDSSSGCYTSGDNWWSWLRIAIQDAATAAIGRILIGVMITIFCCMCKLAKLCYLLLRKVITICCDMCKLAKPLIISWSRKVFNIFCCMCKLAKSQIQSWWRKNNNRDIESFLKSHRALAIKRYKFSDVKKMTNSFEVKLGQGGFGAVYKGKLLPDHPVAVKILNESKGNGEDFINEVASISRTSHVNIVTLLGFCLEGSKKVLIYEYVANGSLENYIYKEGSHSQATSSLSWDKFHQIAVGIARGLEYLHKGCNTRILHFDIKPHNILLDEDFCPKISDFGLAKICRGKESIISLSDARGTIGYVAPEVWNRHFGGVSHKSDVYSYGMMLLEIVGGRKNINAEASHTSEIYFPHCVYRRLEQGTNLRPDEGGATEENEIIKRLTMVGLWCIQTFPHDRPTMSRVIDMLEGNIDLLDMPPKPVLSSPTRSVVESDTNTEAGPDQ